MFLVFLVDWKSALESGRQVSDAVWKRQVWGPFAQSVFNAVIHKKRVDTEFESELEVLHHEIVRDIKVKYSKKQLPELKDFIPSTYPMIMKSPGQFLDLPALAMMYQEDFKEEREKALA